MPDRHEYSLRLDALAAHSAPPTAQELSLRPPERADTPGLARLMIEAYRGTIDYDGETLEDAAEEVTAYFSGERGGPALLDASRLGFVGDELAGACLVAQWEERDLPLIAYVMTDARWKDQGLAARLLREVLKALRARGEREVRAVITEGNVPSERLFGGMGFVRVDAGQPA